MSVKSICGIIIASEDPESLAGFYARVLDLQFEREMHGGLAIHYGVDIGEVHFGIHPPENMGAASAGRAATSIAFNVESLGPVLRRLGELGAREIAAPHDEGFGTVATYLDPQGNPFEIVELNYDFDN